MTDIRHQVDVNSFQKLAAKTLKLNEGRGRQPGDAGAGGVRRLCRQSPDRRLHPDRPAVEPDARRRHDRLWPASRHQCPLASARRLESLALAHQEPEAGGVVVHRPFGAGKSTIANLVEQRLLSLGHHTYLLDGDNVRHGLNKDLGFTTEDRVENIRRVAEVSKLMVDAGLITLVSFISPYRSERQLAREMLGDGEFIEIYVSTPLKVAEERDVKGLYAKAREGLIKNFTGIDSPYEAPEKPDLVLDTSVDTAEVLAERIVRYMFDQAYLLTEPNYYI
ncbi:MAG: adenylyl-sulfate kinase [Asticcacaulis sp.]